ncbi:MULTISPECIES: hypothetical protein [unclassified Nocardia]|uniref:hypothetical protein n=1 Tax=unclassified Nocardia TaxID=2637762 RepID=UPI001CE3CA2B|nr:MULTISPECIES: hypothetical protein [unclassified Nocardia]
MKIRYRQATAENDGACADSSLHARLSGPMLVGASIAVILLTAGCAQHNSVSSTRPILGPAPSVHQNTQIPVGPGPTNYTHQAQPAPGSCHYRKASDGQPLPDPVCTPGAVNPKVTPEDIATTICKSGYTGSIRPAQGITDTEKKGNAQSYAYTGDLGQAEYDHLISLELGGDPNDPRNLWVEPPSPGHQAKDGVNNPKDQVENKLHTLVCGGKVALADAQYAIATDWTTALAVVGHPDGK